MYKQKGQTMRDKQQQAEEPKRQPGEHTEDQLAPQPFDGTGALDEGVLYEAKHKRYTD